MPRLTLRRAVSCVALVVSTGLLLRGDFHIPQQLPAAAEPSPVPPPSPPSSLLGLSVSALQQFPRPVKQPPPPLGLSVSPLQELPPPVKQLQSVPTAPTLSGKENRANVSPTVPGPPSVPVQAAPHQPLPQPRNWPPTKIPAGLIPPGRKPSDWIASVPLLEVHGDGHEIVLTAPHGIPLARESCIGGLETWACTGTFKMAVRHVCRKPRCVLPYFRCVHAKLVSCRILHVL
jgi:hypothetical protein